MERKTVFLVSFVLLVLGTILLGTVSHGQVAAASKVTLCHKPGPNRVIIDVDAAAANAHVAHGDIVGGLRATGLIAPADGEILDNGRVDGSDLIVWDFDWISCGEATRYHVHVQHVGSPIPIIDTFVSESSYHFASYGYIANRNRFDWEWKVRSFVDGEWGPWSPVRTFDVEPINTD